MAYSLQRNSLVLLSVVLLLACQCGFAHDDILPLKDVREGMKGIGKTVIHGNEIETFNIEVMGILANNKINENVLITGKSILVKVSGKVIEEAGGIAAGMSGSPIYINGKLVGGLSSGWVMTDHTVGMVTPIEEMLEIWDYPLSSRLPAIDSPIRWTSAKGVILNGKVIHNLWEMTPIQMENQNFLQKDEPVFLRAGTPVFIQGLCERASAYLKSKFKSRNLQAIETESFLPPPSITSPHPATSGVFLEPGSAIGIQLARGDVNLTTLGTLTYKDGKKILGFAHPFLKKGNVAFLLTNAHIYHSFSSIQMPFKIGAPLDAIGIINQDREKGVAGEIGKFPPMVPIQIEIADKDLKRSRSLNFQVVRDNSVFSTVIESTFIQAVGGIMDREGEGTALMGISIECENLFGNKFNFRRENLFYSKVGILDRLVEEITKVVEMISESEFEEIIPTKLLIKLEIEKKRRTMTIEKVEVKNSSITPGGLLEVWVTLRPFREKRIVKKAKIPIPADIGKEDLRLTVSGVAGAMEEAGGESEGNRETKKNKDHKADEPVFESFEKMMDEWVNSPLNSDLLLQLSFAGDEEKKIKLNGKNFEIISNNSVVVGSIDTTISLSED